MRWSWPGLVGVGLVLGMAASPGCSGGGGSGAGGTTGSGTGGTSGGAGGATGSCVPKAMGGASGSGGSSGTSTYANLGVCGRRIQATADATTFDGYEERYLLGEQGLGGPGSEVCIVRFDLKRVADAPAPCADCSWAHTLQYSNPSVVLDKDGVCAKSDLAFDTAAIGKVTGSRVAIGFAPRYGGAHASARLTYSDLSCEWEISGNANWSESTKAFKSDYKEGFCNYGP